MTRHRHGLETRASRWRPKTRRDLNDAQAAETAAARRTSDARAQERAQVERVRALQDERIERPTRTLQRRLERPEAGRDLSRSVSR